MAHSKYTAAIETNIIYHVYNRAIGQAQSFLEDADYHRFLGTISSKLLPVSEIYAYCLLSNHYHFMLKVTSQPLHFSKAMGELGVSYAKWFNQKYSRQGALFISPFKRLALASDIELAWLPWYIHRNPLHHGVTQHWADYKWSSFSAYATGKPTKLNTNFLLDFYGGRDKMVRHHAANDALWRGESFED
ncbi:MAG: hypothetical protein EAY75_05545 [Bacteroidetes bacterium]|nr:MAG: hypothetical protein EAY75_05545 [Bacteroidota bacterium]